MINLVKDIGEMSVRVHHLSGQVDNLTNNWRATRTAIEKLEESYTNLSKESTQVHLSNKAIYSRYNYCYADSTSNATRCSKTD